MQKANRRDGDERVRAGGLAKRRLENEDMMGVEVGKALQISNGKKYKEKV